MSGTLFILAFLLLLGVAPVVRTQTLESRSRPSVSDPPSDTKTTPGLNTLSKAELKRRTSEAKRYYDLGQKYGNARLFRQAAEVFQKAIDLRPDYADAYYGLGHAYYDLGHWAAAVAAFEKTIELNPKDKEAFARLKAAEAELAADQNGAAGVETSSGNATPATTSTGEAPKPTPSLPAVSEADRALLETYRVGVGDVLDLIVPKENSEETISVTVSESGSIELPSLNAPVKVAGLNQTEIAASLNESLKGDSKTPIRVAVREYNSHAIMVSGLVKEPGTKMLQREAIPLYVVLADAQLQPEAGLVKIESGSSPPVDVDLVDSNFRNVLVRPGDVLTVQVMPTQYFYVGGEVREPGEKVFRRGLSLTQAILAAGGVSEKGKKIEVGRERSGGLLETTSFKLKEINSGKVPDPSIKPGDRIMVLP